MVRAGTDWVKKRTVPGAEERLFKDLRWAGLQWDEGPEVGGPYGPYRQSARLYLYNTHVQELLKKGSAYRCFCSTERIDKLNRLRHDKGLPLGYDRKCVDIPADEAQARAAKGESHIIRFHVPKQYPKYNDLVYGKSGHGDAKSKQHLADEPVFDDPVLIKADGFPTYHFANVVDDKLMQISHVVRGSEWMSSTPLHIALYNAFDWTPPQYAHVPLLVDANRQKLSKRNFDSDISSFRDKQGIYPAALINFSALLGWSHQQKSDVMDLSELEKIFDLKITKGNTIVAFEKLNYLQEKHALRRIQANGDAFERIIRDVAVALLESHGAPIVTKFIGKRNLRDVVASMLHIKSLSYLNPQQFVQNLGFLFKELNAQTRNIADMKVVDVSLYKDLRTAASTLSFVPEEHWEKETLRNHLHQIKLEQADPADTKAATKSMYKFLRWALLGGAPGPDLPSTMEILGRDVSLARIKEAVQLLQDFELASSSPNIKVQRVPKGQREWQGYSLPAVAAAAAS